MAKDKQTKMVVFDMAGTTVEDNDNVHQSLINAMDFSSSRGHRQQRTASAASPQNVARL